MRTLVPGHRYSLSHLKSQGTTILQFYQDPDLHGGVAAGGPNAQEVIRALIERVQTLDAEKPWAGNRDIVSHLRQALAGFEARALLRKAEKGIPLEALEVGPDGHLLLGE